MNSKLVNLDFLINLKLQLQMRYYEDYGEYLSKGLIFTCGGFDILHYGHVKYLEEASKFGNILLIALNSDESIKLNKGSDRPFHNQDERAYILSCLNFVNYITIFSDKSPINLIDILRPEYYIKGGDYNYNTINQEEKKLVDNYGGNIKIIKTGTSISTTEIAKKIEKL